MLLDAKLATFDAKMTIKLGKKTVKRTCRPVFTGPLVRGGVPMLRCLQCRIAQDEAQFRDSLSSGVRSMRQNGLADSRTKNNMPPLLTQ